MELDTDKIDDAVLALLFLGLHNGARAWKGFDWEAMNRLHERGYITDPREGEVGGLHRGRFRAGQASPQGTFRQARRTSRCRCNGRCQVPSTVMTGRLEDS